MDRGDEMVRWEEEKGGGGRRRRGGRSEKMKKNLVFEKKVVFSHCQSERKDWPKKKNISLKSVGV